LERATSVFGDRIILSAVGPGPREGGERTPSPSSLMFPEAARGTSESKLRSQSTPLRPAQTQGSGVEAELQVYEGMSHAQYNFDPYAPETKEVFTEIARFFDKHLGKAPYWRSCAI
jgi:hypothetical protein